MPSRHHVWFQQRPFQVHMMIIQGLVDSSQNLKIRGLNTDLCSDLHLNLLWKDSLFLRSVRRSNWILVSHKIHHRDCNSGEAFEMTRIPLFIFTGFVPAIWGIETRMSGFASSASLLDRECLYCRLEWKSKSSRITLTFAVHLVLDCEQLSFVEASFLVKILKQEFRDLMRTLWVLWAQTAWD